MTLVISFQRTRVAGVEAPLVDWTLLLIPLFIAFLALSHSLSPLSLYNLSVFIR
jgi:hypothetical protein